MLVTPEIIHEAAQCDRLKELVPGWLNTIPLYQKAAVGTDGRAMRETFQLLPQITKRDIRHNFPQNFLPNGITLEDLIEQELIELEHTSGTSELRTPLLLPFGWWAQQENRTLRLNRLVADLRDEDPSARRVTISSPVCNGDICYTSVPSHSDRILGNTLVVSLSRQPFFWSDAELARMAKEVLEWQPRFLDVDPVYGVVFARYCERQGIQLPSLRFILCSYEFVSLTHRRLLQRVFGVPVFNLYGSTETGHLLMENEQGVMVPSLDTAFMEVAEADSQGVGQLIVTTLSNDYMPLIRYRIGDLVEQRIAPYQTAYVVHGRSADASMLSDGRRVTVLQVDQCFEGLGGVIHYQLFQQRNNRWLLRFVPDVIPPSPGDLKKLQQRLSERLVTSHLTMEAADALMPENSGKFRLGYPMGD